MLGELKPMLLEANSAAQRPNLMEVVIETSIFDVFTEEAVWLVGSIDNFFNLRIFSQLVDFGRPSQ